MSASTTNPVLDQQYLQLLLQLANHQPTMPDQLTQFWLRAGGGIALDDVRLVRLMSMYCQMCVTDVIAEATAFVTPQRANGDNTKPRRVLDMCALQAVMMARGDHGLSTAIMAMNQDRNDAVKTESDDDDVKVAVKQENNTTTADLLLRLEREKR